MNKSHFIMLASVVIILLTACAPSQDSIQTAVAETQAEWTDVPTQTPYATYTLVPAIEVTKLVIVTATFTNTPEFTPTITNTPSKTPTSTQTPNVAKTATAQAFAKLTSNKSPGVYLVKVDIAPGVWRSQGKGDNCYWQRSTKTGDIIANYFGMAGGTIYIAPTDFSVLLDKDCEIWGYLSPP